MKRQLPLALVCVVTTVSVVLGLGLNAESARAAGGGVAPIKTCVRGCTWKTPSQRLQLVAPAKTAIYLRKGRDSGPSAWSESVSIQRGGDVLWRTDLYANPDGWDVHRWLHRHHHHLVGHGSVTRSIQVAGRSALRIDTPRNPQVLPRAVVLVATDRALIALTCDGIDRPGRRKLFARALAQLSFPGPKDRSNKGRSR